MPDRTTKFASTLLVGLLAAATFFAGANKAASAVDACLSGPKGSPPQGGHWYYRLDRATKRHCWYVGEEREKQARSNVAQTAKPASPQQKETAMPPSVANARAELTGAEPSEADAVKPAPPLSAGPDNQGAKPPAADPQRSAVASRWPDQSGARASSNAAPNKSNSGTVANSPSAFAAGQLAADGPGTASSSAQTLLIVIVAALVLAAGMGTAIFRFGSTRRADRNLADAASTPPQVYPNANAPTRRVDLPSRRREAAVPNEITELLCRLSREAAT
jgi:hypothetical protein